MSDDMGWLDAIVAVLQKAGTSLHYTEIAEKIVADGLRKKKVGAKPSGTVYSIISQSMKNPSENGPRIIRLDKGRFVLQDNLDKMQDDTDDKPIEDEWFIKAFGMYWRRELVNWNATAPRLYGLQEGGQKIDFGTQVGVYLLHDGARVVYAGKTEQQTLGKRLRDHTKDRLNGRWDRFSWFGLYGIQEKNGEIQTDTQIGTVDITNLISMLEAVLISTHEPPLNRRNGDGLAVIEYLQEEDPEFKRLKERKQIEELLKRVNA